MKGYKVEKINYYGLSKDCGYSLSKKMAIQIMNHEIRKEFAYYKGSRVDNKEDIPEHEVKDGYEVICKYPYYMIAKDDVMVCQVPHWERCSYEYSEYDVYETTIRLIPINLLES